MPERYHYPSLDAAVRARLLARGVDPEASTTAFLAAIRAGDPLDHFGRSRGRSLWNDLRGRRGLALPGLPLAMVLTDDERAQFLAARATYWKASARFRRGVDANHEDAPRDVLRDSERNAHDATGS